MSIFTKVGSDMGTAITPKYRGAGTDNRSAPLSARAIISALFGAVLVGFLVALVLALASAIADRR